MNADRSQLEKDVRRLILAASDMDQAAAAARALEAESDGVLARALETAMVVCYQRPFTKSDLQLSGEYIPTSGEDARAHADLQRLRNKVYAHTDNASGRQAKIEVRPPHADDIIQVVWTEEWLPFPRESLPYVIALCERLAERLRSDAARTQMTLNALP